MKINLEYCTAEYEDNKEMRDKVFKAVIEWYTKHESFDGESISQSDEPIIDAPSFLANLADDVIKFEVTWNE